MPKQFIPLLLITTALGLCACGGSGGSSNVTNAPSGELAALSGGGPALEQRFYDATVVSFDGTNIEVTVYQPALSEGQPAPLILNSHGFGGSRVSDPNSVSDGGADVPEQAMLRAWEQGYFVISFDERGFGESGGNVMAMDPDFEGRDISAVIDWAQANLSPHLARRGNDPVVGSLGLSYGGGFQLIGAAVDNRFDAIVPSAGWNSLATGLNPNNVPKSAWIDILGAAALAGSQGTLDPFVLQAVIEAQTGSVSPQLVARVFNNSLASFCAGTRVDGRGVPDVDAFLIQGATDTLLNINEAQRNAECLRAAGNDVRILVTRNGHFLPALQMVEGQGVAFTLDTEVDCAGQRFDTAQMMLDFLNEKLLGVAPPLPIPEVCFVVPDRAGLVLERIPQGGQTFTLPQTAVTTGVAPALLLSLLNNLPVDVLLDLLADLPANTADAVTAVLAGLSDPASLANGTPQILALIPTPLLNQIAAFEFVPLVTATEAQMLAGIPIMDIDFAGDGPDPRVFLGMGVQRGANATPVLVDDQLLPLRGFRRYQEQLVGVSLAMQPGDVVGLLVYSFHPQYANSFSFIPGPATLTGSVALPLR